MNAGWLANQWLVIIYFTVTKKFHNLTDADPVSLHEKFFIKPQMNRANEICAMWCINALGVTHK